MSKHLIKAWDWSKNTDQKWLVPCPDSAYLAERWLSRNFRNILDLGCGLGRHSIYMARHLFDVTAVDLSEHAVDHVRTWAEKEHLSVRASVCDMMELPFESESFDCIIAYNVIYHTDRAGFLHALSEIRRVLYPGGELYLTLISKNTYSYQHAEQYPQIDENTLLRTEHGTEENVPHFYIGPGDMNDLFEGWIYELAPVEHWEYNFDHPEFYSVHWSMLLRKNSTD